MGAATSQAQDSEEPNLKTDRARGPRRMVTLKSAFGWMRNIFGLCRKALAP